MSLVVYLYRFGNFFDTIGLKFIGLFISFLNRFIFSCWIPSSAKIGRKFKLGYGGLGVVIHNNALIGNNVTIAQNVTIGRNLGEIKVPVIGNDVYIGTGSVIFGEIIIGDNVIIGANSVINKSIPPNCTVIGNPLRIIKHNRTLKYYELDNKIEQAKL